MPMEGQATRLATPLTARDKQAIAVVATGFAIVVVAVLVFGHAFRPAPSNAGCVILSGPSSTGYLSSRNCGPLARRFCAMLGRINPAVTAQCRRLALPLPPS